MARRGRAKKKAARGFEVRVSFEPHRLAEECLEQAYSCVAPVAWRAIDTRRENAHTLAVMTETLVHRAEGER